MFWFQKASDTAFHADLCLSQYFIIHLYLYGEVIAQNTRKGSTEKIAPYTMHYIIIATTPTYSRGHQSLYL